MASHRILARGVSALAALLLAFCAAAAMAGFSAALSPAERTLAGIAKLSSAQAAALDSLVDRDAALAREGGVTGFASSFTARRTPKERTAAGIDLLTDRERASLDALAARQIAYGPAPMAPFTYAPPAGPAPDDALVSAPLRPEVHGDVSLTLGGGRGSSFYGASADVFVTDPSGKFTFGMGVSEFRGKGFVGPLGPCLLEPYDPFPAGW
jgi:hypothetical protein